MPVLSPPEICDGIARAAGAAGDEPEGEKLAGTGREATSMQGSWRWHGSNSGAAAAC